MCFKIAETEWGECMGDHRTLLATFYRFTFFKIKKCFRNSKWQERRWQYSSSDWFLWSWSVATSLYTHSFNQQVEHHPPALWLHQGIWVQTLQLTRTDCVKYQAVAGFPETLEESNPFSGRPACRTLLLRLMRGEESSLKRWYLSRIFRLLLFPCYTKVVLTYTVERLGSRQTHFLKSICKSFLSSEPRSN